MSNLAHLNEKLSLLFAQIEMPKEGINKTWLCHVNELNIFTKELVALHGMLAASIISDRVAALSTATLHTWNMREFLTELYFAILRVEQDISGNTNLSVFDVPNYKNIDISSLPVVMTYIN